MKRIKYTPDAADKLRALKTAISKEKGPEVSKIFDVVSDYRYIFVS